MSAPSRRPSIWLNSAYRSSHSAVAVHSERSSVFGSSTDAHSALQLPMSTLGAPGFVELTLAPSHVRFTLASALVLSALVLGFAARLTSHQMCGVVVPSVSPSGAASRAVRWCGADSVARTTPSGSERATTAIAAWFWPHSSASRSREAARARNAATDHSEAYCPNAGLDMMSFSHEAGTAVGKRSSGRRRQPISGLPGADSMLWYRWCAKAPESSASVCSDATSPAEDSSRSARSVRHAAMRAWKTASALAASSGTGMCDQSHSSCRCERSMASSADSSLNDVVCWRAPTRLSTSCSSSATTAASVDELLCSKTAARLSTPLASSNCSRLNISSLSALSASSRPCSSSPRTRSSATRSTRSASTVGADAPASTATTSACMSGSMKSLLTALNIFSPVMTRSAHASTSERSAKRVCVRSAAVAILPSSPSRIFHSTSRMTLSLHGTTRWSWLRPSTVVSRSGSTAALSAAW
mmetsp:Transcript_27758/g.96065  ORF Transcript_27758/g.96065 Transcript_27758/m.96065 type:complete len:471 (+) Transcript_27758:360-1772(+)